MDATLTRTGIWFGILLLCLGALANAQDAAFSVHMLIVSMAAFVALIATVWKTEFDAKTRDVLRLPTNDTLYDDDPVRWGVIATVFWGIAGLLAGLFIALAARLPGTQFRALLQFRARCARCTPRAVIFAFGGNALIATSFYVVQRTCRARLAFPGLARFVFWGYQLFIVLAATGYLLGITQSKEYAEPEWYVDWWLTIVWVAYLAVFVGTILKRERAAHLCRQLVLPRLHPDHRDAARRQQSGDAGQLPRLAQLSACSPACRMR